LGLGTALLATTVPAGAAETGGSIASQPVTREIDLTTLPRATVRRSTPGEAREIPRVIGRPVAAPRLPATGGEATPPLPPAGRPALRLLRQFPGIPFSDVFPPDPNGDVGRAHYVQLTNSRTGSFLAIFDKRGRAVVPLLELRSLLGDQTEPCFTAAFGDPIVLYDRLADRWLLSEFAIEDPEEGPFHLCVYVSRSSDPVRGGWHVYDFLTPRFPDYPKYAAWPDAYYVTTNESDAATEQPSPTVYALERAAMLRGERARAIFRSVEPLPNLPFQALTPAVFEGPQRPPRGRRMPLLRQVDTEALGVPGFPRRDLIQVFEAQARFGARPRLEVRLAAQVRVTEFDSDLCGLETFSCIVQPRGAPPLDPLREVILWRLSYKNFGASEALVGDFNVDVDGADTAGVRWFDLRSRGTGWRVNNEGTHAPDPTNRWMGGVAMDREQNIALGYSVSSATVNPGLRFAGRRRGDPFGRLRGEQILIGGGGVQTQSERWGDYFSMAVDPVDQCTFWFTGEYVGLGNIWRTRIASFVFPGCR
jgi:hypothetical protein